MQTGANNYRSFFYLEVKILYLETHLHYIKLINKFSHILVVASIIILSVILFHAYNKVDIDTETLKTYLELDRSKSHQEKTERQYVILIMFQQVGYIFAFILVPVGFSLYQNRSALKWYKRKLNNAFKAPPSNKRRTLAERLIITYPQLTSNDLNLCKLVYRGLSSKEIARELNISPSSANTARYRLRKKLNIPSDEELMSFLYSI